MTRAKLQVAQRFPDVSSCVGCRGYFLSAQEGKHLCPRCDEAEKPPKRTVKDLEFENRILREAARDLHWMARRYADGRSTYATGMFNDHTRALLKLGLTLNPGAEGVIWARDGMGRSFDGLTEEQANMGRKPDWWLKVPVEDAREMLHHVEEELGLVCRYTIGKLKEAIEEGLRGDVPTDLEHLSLRLKRLRRDIHVALKL